MAKLYALTETDLQTIKQMVAWYRSGGSGKSGRPVPTRRRQLAPGGPSVLGSIAAIALDVPALTFTGSLTSPTFKVTPGLIGTPDVASFPLSAGGVLLDWEREDQTGGGYEGSPYLPAFTTWAPVWEEVAGIPRLAVRAVYNSSPTEIRGSVADPVICQGREESKTVGGASHKMFIVENVMDLRGLPGYAKGTAPTAGDDPDLQIPYHSGGDKDFKLDSVEC